MKVIIITWALLVACCNYTYAEERLVTATILGNPAAVLEYIGEFRHTISRPVEFNMASVGGSSHFPVTASVYGSLGSDELVNIFKAIELPSITSKIDGPWRVAVIGDSRAAEVVVEPVYRCSNSIGVEWVLSNPGDQWVVIDKMPGKIPGPCDPTP